MPRRKAQPKTTTPITTSTPSPVQQSQKKREFLVLYYPSDMRIEEDDVITLTKELKQNVKVKKEDLRLDLIVHSWGGDAYSAFKMINTIRDFSDEVYALVPIRAVSAASLLLLGTDKIYMSSQSQLGPLDSPTEHPTMGGTQVSSIDCVKSIAYLEGILKSTAINRYIELRNGVGLGKKDAINIAYDIAEKFVKPLTSKLDPIQTSKSSRDLEIAKIYGQQLLQKYMFKNEEHSSKKAEDIITKMVYDYPAHGFAICYDEAYKLGLKVYKSEEYLDWERVWTFFNRLANFKKRAIWHLTEGQFKSWTK